METEKQSIIDGKERWPGAAIILSALAVLFALVMLLFSAKSCTKKREVETRRANKEREQLWDEIYRDPYYDASKMDLYTSYVNGKYVAELENISYAYEGWWIYPIGIFATAFVLCILLWITAPKSKGFILLIPVILFLLLIRMFGPTNSSFVWKWSYWRFPLFIYYFDTLSRESFPFWQIIISCECLFLIFQVIYILNQRKRNWMIAVMVVMTSLLGGLEIIELTYTYPILDGVWFCNILGVLSIVAIMVALLLADKRLLPVKKSALNCTDTIGSQTLFCPSCGARFPKGKKFCDQCGTCLKELPQLETMEQNSYSSQDEPSMGIAILGFLIPLAGFIMWVAWNDQMPQKARSAGKGALIGFITYAVVTVVSIIIVVSLL